MLSLKLGDELIGFLNGSNLVGFGLHDGCVGISNGLGVDGDGLISFLGALLSLGEDLLGSLVSFIGLLLFFFGAVQDFFLCLNLSPLGPVFFHCCFTMVEINVVDSGSTFFSIEPSEMGVGSYQTFLEGRDTRVALFVGALGVIRLGNFVSNESSSSAPNLVGGVVVVDLSKTRAAGDLVVASEDSV